MADATAYCQSLNLGGLTGWRLPSVKELQSLVDFGAWDPAIDTTAFPGTPAVYFRTSTLHATNASTAWVVQFRTGGTLAIPSANQYLVRCVHGG